MTKGSAGRLALAAATFAAGLALWLALARSGWIGRTLLADPIDVARALAGAFDPAAPPGARVLVHAEATLVRALAGWVIALLVGMGCGVALGARAWAYVLGEPLFELARAVPPILAFPLLLVAFDFGEPAYVGTIVLGCVPIVAITVARGRLGASRERSELLAVFGVPRSVRALTAIMEVMPSCFLAARLALSTSLVIAVVTEMVFTPRSGIALGALAKEAQMSFETDVYFAVVVVVGLFGYAANVALRAVERRLGLERSTST